MPRPDEPSPSWLGGPLGPGAHPRSPWTPVPFPPGPTASWGSVPTGQLLGWPQGPSQPPVAARTSCGLCCSDASSWILISGHAGSPGLPASGWGDREGPGEGGRREPPHWPRGGTREMDAWMAGGHQGCAPVPSPSLGEPLPYLPSLPLLHHPQRPFQKPSARNHPTHCLLC